jgi:hypothetical protein
MVTSVLGKMASRLHPILVLQHTFRVAGITLPPFAKMGRFDVGARTTGMDNVMFHRI